MKKISLLLITILIGICSMATTRDILARNSKSGKASYYHDKFNGRKTSSGEVFRNTGYTAASNHYALGTYVKVTNTKNGKVVYVKINDRMGHQSRIIDLTNKAAKDLNFLNGGLANVIVERVSEEEGQVKILAQIEGLNNTSAKDAHKL